MRDVLLVAVGGALGSVARWGLSSWAARLAPQGGIPWGTLGVNLAGSAAIGFVLTLAFERNAVPLPMRLFLVAGLLGGFTTFSAFAWETLALARDGHTFTAAGYVVGSVVGGLLAAAGGAALAARV